MRLFHIAAAWLAMAAWAAGSATILPQQFGGWAISGSPKVGNDPSVADAMNSDLLREYGFTDFESATYDRDDGRKLVLRAARFADASGAFGAFNYYKKPEMATENIGDAGASLNDRVLFFRGNILIEASLERVTAMSAAELRELASLLPLPAGNTRNLPTLPSYLPSLNWPRSSVKYIEGPVGLGKLNPPVPGDLVDFNAGAEVVVGTYTLPHGEASLMLIAYPTPQIAAEHLRRIGQARQQSASQPLNPDFSESARDSTLLRRTGPIVVLAWGPVSSDEAGKLINSVNYEAEVTWNQNTYFNKKASLASFLVSVIVLSGIIMGIALVAGLAFGGVRLLSRRYFPNTALGRPDEWNFISLHLSEDSDKLDRF
ncbi:MAG: hypothetical protein JOY93_03840 [Acidobacteriales bacterium]|nr:hypothetical protein [Terriglobales bacterium]